MANRFVLNETAYHGAGAIAEIATEAKGREFKKALICSDPDLIKFGVTGKVTAKTFSKLNKDVLSVSKYIDIDLGCDKDLIKKIRKEYKKLEIIISHHNFEETPYEKELKLLTVKMLKKKPDIIKLALFARSISDSFRILDFLQELNKKGIKAICIGIIFCEAIAIKQIIKNKTHTRLFTTSIIFISSSCFPL